MTSALTTALASLLSQRAGAWTGTATEIQIALAAELPDDLRTLDASRFSARLRAETDTLAAAGIEVQPPDGGGRSGRVWTVRRAGTAVPPVPHPLAPPTVTALPEQITIARTALHRALIAGQDTRAARAVLATLEDRDARQAAEEAAATAAVQHERQAAIAARAADLATTAAAALAATLGALQPPPAPTARSAA